MAGFEVQPVKAVLAVELLAAILVGLHACRRGTRDAAVRIIAVHLLEHAVLADDRPNVALIVIQYVMISA